MNTTGGYRVRQSSCHVGAGRGCEDGTFADDALEVTEGNEKTYLRLDGES